jgi:hypothetical protein
MKAGQLGEDCQHRVVGGLVGDVDELGTGGRGARGTPAHLGQRDAQQPGMQLTLGLLQPRAVAGQQAAQPPRRLRIKLLHHGPGKFHGCLATRARHRVSFGGGPHVLVSSRLPGCSRLVPSAGGGGGFC